MNKPVGCFFMSAAFKALKEKLKFMGKFFLRVGIKGDVRTFTNIYILYSEGN